MTTTHPASRRGTVTEPGRRLSPSPRGDRTWRTVLTLLGATVLVLMLLALSAVSVSGWWLGRGFDDVPATTELGTPETLTLSSGVGDVRVLPSTDVEVVTLALVEEGETALPEPGETARARLSQHGDASAPVLDIRQSEGYGPVPWLDEHHDVLVLVPQGHQLALDVTTDVGDIQADGEFTSLAARSAVGDVHLGPVTATESLAVRADVGTVEIELRDPAPAVVEVTASVGDVDLRMPPDAVSEVRVDTEVGETEIALPGTGRWEIEARTELGERRIDPGVTGAPGATTGTLTVTSELGDVLVTR